MRKNKLPNLISILILTLITVVMWIGLSIYRALSQKPSPVIPQEISTPLDPKLDTDSLNKIQSRIFLNDSQIPELKINGSPQPSASIAPEATPLESPSPIPSETPATSSGTIP